MFLVTLDVSTEIYRTHAIDNREAEFSSNGNLCGEVPRKERTWRFEYLDKRFDRPVPVRGIASIAPSIEIARARITRLLRQEARECALQ